MIMAALAPGLGGVAGGLIEREIAGSGIYKKKKQQQKKKKKKRKPSPKGESVQGSGMYLNPYYKRGGSGMYLNPYYKKTAGSGMYLTPYRQGK